MSDVTALVGLPRLRELKLNGCHLGHETSALWLMPSLRELYLGRGSIRGVSSEVLSSSEYSDCLPALRAHIEDLLASDRDGDAGGHAVADVKLMILGNGNAGKTQICRRLRGEGFDERVPSTHGIQVTSAPLSPDDEGNPITLRIWDFGGQDIYHGTHALFLRSRAVFPIVWSADTDHNNEPTHNRHGLRFRNYPLDYWLAYVKHLGGRQSPVLIVQSKVDTPADRRPLPLPADWSSGLDWHVALDSSAARPRGIDPLKLQLTEAVHWLRGTQGVTKIGAGRAAVKAEIERCYAVGQQTMPVEDFEALCAADGRVSSPALLLAFLHDIGTVFYRQGLFGDQIILDQQWALRAVYAVFDRDRCWRQLTLAQGRFTRTLLGALVWDKAAQTEPGHPGYSPEDQQQFIGLMRASGMCFQVRKASDEFEAEYIAPDLLPGRDDPEVAEKLAWHDPARADASLPGRSGAGTDASSLGRSGAGADASGRISFAMLPQGLLRTVMAAVGEKAGRAGTYWRDGFAFYDADTKSRVLVAQSWDETWAGEITIDVQGGDAAKLLQHVLKLIQDRTDKFGARPTGITTSLDHTRGGADDVDDDTAAASPSPSRRNRPAGPEGRAPGAGRDREDPLTAFRFAHAPSTASEFFVSYAWGDDRTDDGRERETTVDRLCDEAVKRGKEIIRDKTAMRSGDRISTFMDRIAHGALNGRVFIVLSDKYLRSPYCMHELFEVWRMCREDDAEFRKRTRVFVLPTAGIETIKQRADHAAWWRRRLAETEEQMKGLDVRDIAQADAMSYRLMHRFANHSADILKLVHDTLSPRRFDEFVEYGFED